MTFVLPPRAQVGVLDPEIAGEGEKIIMSDGDTVTWTPPPAKPVIPDWSQVKSLRKYFGRVGLQVWPAWLYHPTEPARLLKDAHEAAELGICFRETTSDERAQFGGTRHRWAWRDDCKWRPDPYNVVAFDPTKPGHGKYYIATPANPIVAQDALLERLIPLVTASVVAAMKGGGGSAPAHVSAGDWKEFQEFQAWKKSVETVETLVDEAAKPAWIENTGNALAGDERSAWEERAHNKGIKVDGRWSLERLKAEVEKAA